MAERKVGVVGLGNMGGGIACNFCKSGVPLAVWDVAPAACRAFEGLAGVDIAPPGEMAATCNVIFFVVPATPEIASCFEGDNGVLVRASEGLVVYDFTTMVHPVDASFCSPQVANLDEDARFQRKSLMLFP